MSDKLNPKNDLKAYLQETRSWESDKIQSLLKSNKVAWKVAIASACLTFISVAALAMLTPLKQTEPYVIRVDNSTGIVDVVQGLKNGSTAKYDEVVNKYFSQIYVRSREGYNKELSEHNYRTVGLLSSNAEQQRYFNEFNPKNPQSPLNVYGQYAKVNIDIKSTTFITENVALVRYVREISRGTDRPELSHWTSTITFRYLGTPMKEADRAINPLGFQVTDYRSDPESLNAIERARHTRTQPTFVEQQPISDNPTVEPPALPSSASQ